MVSVQISSNPRMMEASRYAEARLARDAASSNRAMAEDAR